MATRKLKTKLKYKIEVCGAHYQMVMNSYNEMVLNDDIGMIDVKELMVICQPIGKNNEGY